MHGRAASLPPLIAELEDKPAEAHTVPKGGVPHDLMRERCYRRGLRHAVLLRPEAVPGIGAVLANEERLLGELLPFGEEVTGAPQALVMEDETVVVVRAPDVDVGELRYDLGLRQAPVDRRDGVVRVVPLGDERRLADVGQAGTVADVLVTAVVVPLVAYDPHEDGGMILHGPDLARDVRQRLVGVGPGRVEHRDVAAPEGVQDLAVPDALVGPHCVDPRLVHEVCIALDAAPVVQAFRVHLPLRNGIPVHALEMDRHSVYEKLPPVDGHVPGSSDR
mmetsp:Transcript_7715/g.20928  ORF Transcript_7715/g.20928 Transcript_7715/m.20928 type:complete len:277 (+) Transcript_7715:306-1136(+)